MKNAAKVFVGITTGLILSGCATIQEGNQAIYDFLEVPEGSRMYGMAGPPPVTEERADRIESNIRDNTQIIPSDVENKTLEYVENLVMPTLKDPYTARVRFLPQHTNIRVCNANISSRYDRPRVRLWASAFGINAKNSYGGYTGETEYLLYFIDGEPVGHGRVAGSVTDGEYFCPESLRQM